MTITVSFTVISVIIMVLLGVVLYSQFSRQAINMTKERSEKYLNLSKRNFENHLRTMRMISDALYYTAIKNTDLAKESIGDEFNLLYEADKDNVVSIALYTEEGDLVSAVPLSYEKPNVDVTSQSWFQAAAGQVENLHFSTPHVQNLFDKTEEQYHWVISMSRAVELNYNGVPKQGVLLVDMNFSSLSQMFERVNFGKDSEYIYLCDGSGNIIYHPKQSLIYAGLYEEDNEQVGALSDGTYIRKSGGKECINVVKTVSYTGWKLVSVIPMQGYSVGMGKMPYLAIFIICLAILGVIIINQLVSGTITSPLIKLDNSVKEMENGNINPDIYIGGSREVEHLGRTLQASILTINRLMKEVVAEQELKRQSELDALQSQINPHFLYNTLDSVIWMIEGGQNEGAVYMIKELARLLRISISRGRTIISIKDEIRHASSYMNIQKFRYKNRFVVKFEIQEEILACCTVKLVVQPLLENAIYHGVQAMDEDGVILVRGTRDGDCVYLDVMDNGIGMTKKQIDSLLSGKKYADGTEKSRGNGVGVNNVNNRIKIRFGEDYGLSFRSEPDEGTMARITLPYIKYTDNIEEALNNKTLGGGKDEG